MLAHFTLADAGRRLEDLETPVPVIDIDVVERNLRRWQQRCDEAGLANRPHIKTHKLVPLAKAQIELGAKGITVQKLGEAEVMADAGITDMLLTFNVVGGHKLGRLADLARRTAIKLVADNEAVLEGLSQAAAQAGRGIEVLVECDTGAARNGVQSPAAAIALAQAIDRMPGLAFGGLMTLPKNGARQQMAEFLGEAQAGLAASGLDVPTVSTGGSPDMWKDDGLAQVSEYRAGTYIYMDRMQVAAGSATPDDCALTVLSTVVSVPTGDRAMIDAGSKSLTSDLVGLEGYGEVRALSGARVYNMSEEHGFLDISRLNHKPRVGDLVRITPNHVCPVTNLFDKVVLVRGSEVLGAVRVDARGTVQ
ncbi:D-TA family PLP-dependent enzyme [Aestuariivirga litoralis]|uniref:D-TA family PLP-dependent enzyme n=2 Tax=Aestuariivirga litoralis TaxID=2650924 RepID=A0A2W2ASB9_9HYPH|nr:D-TA family PLP-dependent enzyme [Aestuariivirga litoralis]